MIAGLWIISGACALVFGLLFRESHTIRREHRAIRKEYDLPYYDFQKIYRQELDRAEWLETIEGGLAIATIGLALVAWVLLVRQGVE